MIKKIVVVVLCCASWSWACPKNSVEWKGGCAMMPAALGQEIDNSRWASDEKPAHHPQPAWERGEVTAQMPPSQTYDETTGGTEKADQIKFAQAHGGKPSPPIQVSSDVGKKLE